MSAISSVVGIDMPRSVSTRRSSSRLGSMRSIQRVSGGIGLCGSQTCLSRASAVAAR
jgi:hypothetical protein